MPKKHMSLRLLVCALLAATAALLAPSAASASTGQLSLIQDDRELFGLGGHDPADVMAEMKSIGVDVVRTNVIFYKVYKEPGQRSRPAGFDASRSELGAVRLVGHGPPRPARAGERDQGADDRDGPRPALVLHAAGQVPPGAVHLPPQHEGLRPVRGRGRQALPGHGRLLRDLERAEPRDLAHPAGQARAAAPGSSWPACTTASCSRPPTSRSPALTAARRNRVLLGEVAAISNPLPFLNAALCLDPNGRPFRGRAKRAAGCKAGRLNSGGFAIHPYNFGGYGKPISRTRNRRALPISYMPRLHKLSANAVRRKRIPGRGRGVYITEFGFQTRPPDRRSTISPTEQARYLNESDRLTYGDSKVKMVGQYELYDVPFGDQFNSGLRFSTERGGGVKPSHAAYQAQLVVTRRSASAVEVWGQVRPGGSATVAIQTARAAAASPTPPRSGRTAAGSSGAPSGAGRRARAGGSPPPARRSAHQPHRHAGQAAEVLQALSRRACGPPVSANGRLRAAVRVSAARSAARALAGRAPEPNLSPRRRRASTPARRRLAARALSHWRRPSRRACHCR